MLYVSVWADVYNKVYRLEIQAIHCIDAGSGLREVWKRVTSKMTLLGKRKGVLWGHLGRHTSNMIWIPGREKVWNEITMFDSSYLIWLWYLLWVGEVFGLKYDYTESRKRKFRSFARYFGARLMSNRRFLPLATVTLPGVKVIIA